jgi:hypothetical protein
MRGTSTWVVLLLGVGLAGCPATTTSTGTTTTTTTPPAASATGLGEEADAVWVELTALWDDGLAFAEAAPDETALVALRARLDELLAKLAADERVAARAPGLVVLLRLELDGRLDTIPAACPSAEPVRTPAGGSWERLAARADAVEALAGARWANDWLRARVLEPLAGELRLVRAAIAEGDDWRLEDDVVRREDPARIEAVLARMEPALGRLVER